MVRGKSSHVNDRERLIRSMQMTFPVMCGKWKAALPSRSSY